MSQEKEQTLQELLFIRQGIYNPLLRFAFTNITEEEFTSAWGGEPIKIPAGHTVELPHHLAAKLTKELVDKIMIGNAKLNEIEFYQKNQNAMPNTYRAASSLGVPGARKVWEDQICRLLAPDEESPQTQLMRIKIKEELLRDLKAEPATGSPLDNAPAGLGEFADLTADKETKAEKAPMKLKEVPKSKK
jgi:hypothetical protein